MYHQRRHMFQQLKHVLVVLDPKCSTIIKIIKLLPRAQIWGPFLPRNSGLSFSPKFATRVATCTSRWKLYDVNSSNVWTNQKGREESPMSPQDINQRDLEYILDSWIESRWQENSCYLIGVLMTLVVRHDKYKYQGSSVQNFRPIVALADILIWVSKASSKESWRIILIPEWSIDDYDYGRQEWHV